MSGVEDGEGRFYGRRDDVAVVIISLGEFSLCLMGWVTELYLNCKWGCHVKDSSNTALQVRLEGVCF